MAKTIAADLSPRAYQRAARFLSELDEDWARHIAVIGPCRHEAKPAREPYEALVRAIAYQQLHAKAGDAILGRLLALYSGVSFPAPGQLLATDPELQRACGFSAAKLATIRGIAQATVEGVVPNLEEARCLPDAALIERLVSLRGVGRWTVEMFLIYSLERSDILPVDDFGVREGYARLKGLEKAPTPRQMRDIGQAWSPFRTVAAWYLWRLPSR
ncbi:DNA-3-methyladenine glycosylase 2 family protein [Pseudomonas aeruginosa]|nr:DNA-3-methyladenine glycosylase 2 family protein [Pseudomonas aeruginosa]MBH9455353.1 DNA-3-methyladenine glycosylase 2 family protein [Pseudomonas aeruginosa]MBH9462250.1 DNA-3-methyladenine glycosylase 2 family protein [Pseudomonas aeruginosa]MBT1079031.1 DNA-3-methyladenine glycosylase [Pseudomonas aeruginosa]RTA98076.1 DNA-3-methyladenine glycosylase 2 family protein [Pseudomonas aeruginosa]